QPLLAEFDQRRRFAIGVVIGVERMTTGEIGRAGALGHRRTLIGAHIVDIVTRGGYDLLGVHASADHGLAVPGAPGSLGFALGALPAHRGSESFIDDDSVLNPVLVVQQQMSAIRADSVQDQFTHAISFFIASQWHRVTFGAASRADLRASREITGRSGPRRPEMWTRSRGMSEARGREPSAARGSEP